MTVKNRIISLTMVTLMIISALPVSLVEAASGTDNGEYIKKWIDYVKFSENHDEGHSNSNSWEIDNQKDVIINPIIQIKFKGKLDKKRLTESRIKLKSNDGDYFVLDKDDIWINYDDENDPNKFNGDILKIDLNSLNRKGNYTLRKNTLYKLTLESGALGLHEPNTDGQTTNKEINIHFITGDRESNAKENLGVKSYSSDIQKSDDITRLLNMNDNLYTKLGGSKKDIYIHLNEDIRWNTEMLKNTSNKSVNGEINLDKDDLEKYFKFYRLPKAYERNEAKKLDTEFRYDQQRKVYFKNNEEKVKLDIDSAKIIKDANGNPNIIKITPREDLVFYNMYYLELVDSKIIKDIYGRDLKENVGKYIWTSHDKKDESPKWKINETGSEITAEEIVDNTDSPHNKDVLNYRLYGVPKYNEHIDSNKEKPIIINVDGEIIPNPREHSGKIYPNIYLNSIYTEDALKGIELKEEYRNDDAGKLAIKWYKLEYYLDKDNKKKTKISLYPKGELDSGKPYELTIKKDTFVNRNAREFDKDLGLQFIIEGDKSEERGIYEVDYTKPKLTIKGFNFTEDIKDIVFKNEITGKEIRLPLKYGNVTNIKFVNVDEIEATLTGDALKEFKNIASGGSYKISINFESGSRASSIESDKLSNKFIVYEKPRVKETIAKKDDWFFDKSELYKSFSNGKSGNYLTVIFDNINKKIKHTDSGDILNDFEFYKNTESTENLIDTEREIVYEGFGDNSNLKEFTVRTSGKVLEEITTPYTSAKLYLDDDKYEENETINMTLFDNDLNTNPNTRDEALVEVTRGSQTKEVILRETDRNSGKFEGEIDIWKPFGELDVNDIGAKYIDRQSAGGSVNVEVIARAEIKERVEHRRRAQVYIEKAEYEKGEEVKITVVDKEANKNRYSKDTVKVKIDFPEDPTKNPLKRTLTETGDNTGVFEYYEKNISDDFNITYTYTETETSGADDQVKVHIPITSNIEDDTIYKVSIPKGIVFYTEDEIKDETNRSNDKYEWSFKTSSGSSNVDKSFQGSVPEGYDEDYPIVLTGENFNKQTKVYFRDMNGREYQANVEIPINKTDTLYVYLPYGRNRLKTGLYDIVVKNSKDDKEVIEYGVLSVVPKGDYVPNEDYVETDKDINGDTIREGNLKKYTKTSSDTLELSSRYTDDRKLEFDLDEIMGEDVWTRNIAYRGYRNDTIGRLITESKWADIELRDVSLDTSTGNRDIKIRLGRTEPSVMEMIKKRINDSIKSDFIEISGENYKISSAELSIPYKESNGNNLKVLRYDEDTRRIDTNISFRVDKANKKVEITNAKKGIYVIVE